MATKLRNSDDAMGFIQDPVQETETDLDFGCDPFDIVARMEEEQGYPMQTEVEPTSLYRKL